jgi:hypothetical protein
VTGNVIRYWKQNTNITGLGQLITRFAERLCRQGHEAQTVAEGIEKATTYIDEDLSSRVNPASKSTTDERTLFLHWKYHPNDITRQQL